MDPVPFSVGNHAFGAKYDPVCIGIVKFSEDLFDLFLGILGRSFHSPADEDLIRIMTSVMMVVMVMMAVGLVDPVAVFIHFHFRVIMVVMMVLMLLLIFVIIVMMVMVVLVLILVIIVMMMVVVLVLLLVIIVVMVMMVLVLILIFVMFFNNFREDLGLKVRLTLNSLEDLFAVQFSDRSCDDRCLRVMLTKELDALGDPGVARFICSGEDDRAGVLYLVDEKLSKVLDVKLAEIVTDIPVLGALAICKSEKLDTLVLISAVPA